MLKKILIATHNQAKLTELKSGLNGLRKLGTKVVTLKDLNIVSKPHESGNTFKTNSRIKALFFADLTNLPTLADDGGLIIPFLKNEPGVKSRRWLGYDASDEELIDYTLTLLTRVSLHLRRAYLETCLCFYNPSDDFTIFEQEKIQGYIAEKPYPNWDKGFPYRALFLVKKFNKYYDELTKKEHQLINHRLIALKRLVKRIKKYLIE